mmetsp:Transcript_17332/g.54816  ORF Transcript_17332/g.54816 Transcript_17332/m.54816 type:complete len:298 (-) Transcript_17332:796-1689(-)
MQKRNGCAHDDAPLVAERPPDDQPDQRDSKKIGQHLADGGQLHAVRQVVADARVILLQQFRRGVRPAGFHRLVAKALLGRGVTGRSERVKEGGRYAMVVHPCRWQPRLPEFVKYRAVGQHRGSSAREGFEDGEAIRLRRGAGDEDVGGSVEGWQPVVLDVTREGDRQLELLREVDQALARRPVAHHHKPERAFPVDGANRSPRPSSRRLALPRFGCRQRLGPVPQLEQSLQGVHRVLLGGEPLHHDADAVPGRAAADALEIAPLGNQLGIRINLEALVSHARRDAHAHATLHLVPDM